MAAARMPAAASIRRVLASPALWAFVVMTAAAVLALRAADRNGGLDALRQTLGGAAPLVTIPLHVVVSVSPVPSDFVCVGNGAFYGLLRGAACSWVGWWLAGMVSFAIGRRLRADFRPEAFVERLPAAWSRLPIGHPLVLILSRQIPYAGGYLTTYGAGAAGVTWGRHLWCSAIAIVPGSLVLAAVGRALVD